MCYAPGEFLTGDADVHLGDLQIARVSDSIPVWMSLSQFEYGKHTRVTIDVLAGRAADYRRGADGVRFLIGRACSPTPKGNSS
jgi:uncharacterized protein